MSDTVLIVEDDGSLLHALTFALENKGYEVVTAETGTEALHKIQTSRPDLLILDIMLPGISGLEVARKLRAAPHTADLPIIMLSARTQVDDRIKGLRAGGDDYVSKPFAIDELLARVAAQLQRARRQQAVAATRRARVLGFLGAKGGVGTTTVAVNAALALSKDEHKVIAVELRPCYGTMALHWGLNPQVSWADLFELPAASISQPLLGRHLVSYSSGVRVLLGPQSPDEYRQVELEQVEALLGNLAVMADYVVLDLPCGASELVQASIQRCDRVVLVTEPEASCVKAAATAIDWLISSKLAVNTLRVAVVNRARLAVPMTISAMSQTLGCEIIAAVAPVPDLAARAIQAARPIIVSAPDSLAAEALRRIADQVAA